MKKINSFLIPNSLIGRYVYVAATIFFVLVFIAVLGWYTVQRGVQQHHVNMKVLGDLELSIHDYIVNYQSAKYAALEFLIQPDELHYKLYQYHAKTFKKSFIKLDLSQQKRMGADFNKDFSNLKLSNDSLHIELSKLIAIRQDAEKTFPFTSNMLLLANENAAILALIDRVLSSNKNNDEKLPHDLILLFTDTRYAWSRLMAEYRLLVSVRLGIFTGEWVKAYDERVYNITLIGEKIKTNLENLRKYKSSSLPFVVSDELDQLNVLTTKALKNYEYSVKLLGSSNWRQDLVLLRNNLRPAFSRLDKSIKLLQEKEERVWISSMGELTTIAHKLSYSLWFLLAVCSLLVILGYFIFSNAVLNPIRNIAQALKNEAAGRDTEIKGGSSATEIKNLSDAFYKMRKQVNSRQQRLVNILDNAAEAIITIDNIGQVETFNAAAEHLFGYMASEILGKNILMLIKVDERKYYHKLFLEYQNIKHEKQELGAGKSYEIEILCRCEKLLPVSVKFSKTIINGNALYTALVSDISERRELELERQEHLSEMAHIGRLSIMGEMAAGMAHELNQPLAAMSLYLQGSLRSCDPEADTCKDIITAVHSAIDQVDRASVIIRTMRGFVHRESFHLEVIDINELIKRSVEFVLFSHQKVNPQPIFLLSKEPIMVKVDALQIEQVMVNLIRNAFDAQVDIAIENRVLKITSELDDKGFINVFVIDAGEGVAEENVDKIFNTYFTTKTDGLGMGLSICRSIIEEHDGMLWYEPGIERGSQFCFILPSTAVQTS